MAIEYKVEKGIPIPEGVRRGRKLGSSNPNAGRLPIYPWRQMDVGDSFWIPNGPASPRPSDLFITAKRSGISISTQIGVDGFRVWRIA